MKSKVLSILKTKYPEFVSGEELSGVLGISRTAVWKHIKGLREDGYEIDSRPRIGYRLVKAPDLPYAYELSSLLKTKNIGTKIVHRGTISSTNELAKSLARQGAPDGTVVIAEEQTAGRGRMGRPWHSPAGCGLWFTLILRPPIAPVDASKITLLSAVAVAKAIRTTTGLAAGIKWPNDVLLDGRKVSGILTEMNAEMDKVNYLVVGIGINVDFGSEPWPAELAPLAAALVQQKGQGVSRIKLLAAVLSQFDKLYTEFLRGRFPNILSAWKEMSVTLHRPVRIQSLASAEEGIAFDVDEEGALLLLKADGSMKRVLSGDVSLR